MVLDREPDPAASPYALFHIPATCPLLRLLASPSPAAGPSKLLLVRRSFGGIAPAPPLRILAMLARCAAPGTGMVAIIASASAMSARALVVLPLRGATAAEEELRRELEAEFDPEEDDGWPCEGCACCMPAKTSEPAEAPLSAPPPPAMRVRLRSALLEKDWLGLRLALCRSDDSASLYGERVYRSRIPPGEMGADCRF